MKVNAINQLKANEIIYNEGDATGCLYMVLKGKLCLKGQGYITNCTAGAVVGFEQLEGEGSNNICYSPDGAGVYMLNAENSKNLGALLSSNKDYSGIAVFTQTNMLKELYLHYRRLCKEAEGLFTEIKDTYAEYQKIIEVSGCKAVMIPEIARLEQYNSGKFDTDRIEAYLEYLKIPMDTIKAFYAPCAMLAAETLRHIYEQESELQDECNEVCEYIISLFMLYAGDELNSLFRGLLTLGLEMKAANKATDELEDLIGRCFACRDRIKKLITENTGHMWYDNDEEIKAIYLSYAKGDDFRAEGEADQAADSKAMATVESLDDCMEQLLKYAEFPEEKIDDFRRSVDEYTALEDRDSTDDKVRKLRQMLAIYYYDLYLRAALKYLEGEPADPAVEMLLDFGLLSEKLLTREQLVELVSVKQELSEEPCKVYSMSKWLSMIYAGKRDASRNGMGQDYIEILREKRKQNAIDEKTEKMLLNDKKKKLEHEIKEVMMAGNRVVNGQLSIFVPFIHSGMFIGNMQKAYNTQNRVNAAVTRTLNIDFSLFHRETLYSDPAGGIEKEYLMKQVFPEFIVFPIVGQNVIMWQDITGRKRDSAGRFFVPAFAYNNIEDVMIKAFGQYRWELCKTIQGPNWNNIQFHSLTSEYADYIQFYKKNHDLSEERREKIKMQIQRGRNNLRDIFALDYEIWIKNEANGAMKLNKVAREMLATFCPFAAPIRKKLVSQPMYEEAFARDARERGKRGRELALKIKGLETKGVVIPDEIRETLRFFTEM
ncbi:MAG: cyclic nucleotide-binding domain-containing protein [Lachnospiraceae bacterium]|nr:cyclic nucleotide-binding domain-containing protein [Lachnospiraceae bacterium]